MNVKNLYSCPISQKVPINTFEWIQDTSQFKKDFIKKYNEESGEKYFLEVDVQYLEKLHEFHSDLPFLPERMNIEKFEKLVASLHDKTEYFLHIRNLKQALNHELVLKDVHRVLKFNQNAWLKSYWYQHRSKKKKQKMILNKFFKLMNNAVFGKTIENVKKH